MDHEQVLDVVSTDKVHYVNGRGLVQHTFDAEVPEELSVYPGEEVGQPQTAQFLFLKREYCTYIYLQ